MSTDTSPKAAFNPEDMTGRREATIWQKLGSSNTIWVGVILVALVVAFTALHPGAFLTLFNIQVLFIQLCLLLLLAVGMTFVIITGGIDLSVGSVLIFAGVLSAETMQGLGGGDASNDGIGLILLGLIIAIAGGGLWGLINGWLVAYANVPPLIVTLGSFGAALGVADLITDGNDVRTVPNALRSTVGSGTLFYVPYMVIIVAVVTLFCGWLLHTTKFGRYTYAVGSSPEAARRVGIPLKKQLLWVYLLTGLLAGVAGFLSLAYYGTTTLSSHTSDNLSAISGVVLGGTSLFGGSGVLLGTVFGTFIPQVLSSGFQISNVPPFWQPIAVGIVLVAAVWFDQRRRKARNR